MLEAHLNRGLFSRPAFRGGDLKQRQQPVRDAIEAMVDSRTPRAPGDHAIVFVHWMDTHWSRQSEVFHCCYKSRRVQRRKIETYERLLKEVDAENAVRENIRNPREMREEGQTYCNVQFLEYWIQNSTGKLFANRVCYFIHRYCFSSHFYE